MQFAKLKQSAAAVLAASLFFAAPAAFAKLIWQDFSVSYLRGSNYDPQTLRNPDGSVRVAKTQSEKREVVTFEHASGHDWGSTFLFVDRLMSRDDGYANDATYGEFSVNPKISSNVFASFQMEFGSGDNGQTHVVNQFNASNGNSFNNFLVGPGFNLKIPGASFFNIMLYKRFNDQQAVDGRVPNNEGRVRPNNEQLTATWRFDLFDSRLRFDGFMDYATGFHFKNNDVTTDSGAQTRSHSSFNFTPQIKFDFGRELGWQPKKFWVGMEYVYWKNKFGDANWDEKNPNFLVKWHF